MNKDLETKLNQAANDLYYTFLLNQQHAAEEIRKKIDSMFAQVKKEIEHDFKAIDPLKVFKPEDLQEALDRA